MADTIKFGGITLTVYEVPEDESKVLVVVRKGVFSFSEYGTKAEAQCVADTFGKAVGECCAQPRPDCMGMCVPSIGGACKALRGEL